MRKRLVPVGNSLALIIDKPILELLHLERSTPLELRLEGDRLIITAAAPAPESPRASVTPPEVPPPAPLPLRKESSPPRFDLEFD